MMRMAADRFENPAEKAKSGYFSILFLILGIAIATLLNIAYKKHANT